MDKLNKILNKVYIIGLIEKYKDILIDFAVASLVTLAEEKGTDEIFTLDIKGFRVKSETSVALADHLLNYRLN